MASSVQRAFDLAAGDYDRARRRLIPGFDDFYRAAIEHIPFERERAIDVLDLGAGTGMMAAFVAYNFPSARITLTDISDAMLERARERFELGGARFKFVVSDYGVAPIEGTYDVIVSALSIHHLEHAQKAALFKRIHSALREGGAFVHADQFRAATPELEQRHHDRWLARARELGVGEHDLAQVLERMKLERTAKLDDQLKWMAEAGFREIDCAYLHMIFTVYSGRK
jgi:tRNA (cmo5U34)-methyltransferase